MLVMLYGIGILILQYLPFVLISQFSLNVFMMLSQIIFVGVLLASFTLSEEDEDRRPVIHATLITLENIDSGCVLRATDKKYPIK